MRRHPVRSLFLALALVVLVAGLAVVALPGDGTAPSSPPAVTTHVDGQDQDRARDDKLVVSKDAVDQVKPRLEAGLHGEQLAPGQRRALGRAQHARPPPAAAGASQGFPGCVTRFVVNQSARSTAARVFVLHYTVSANRAGWGDVNAVVALFNRPSFSASSNFVIDGEGHCAYIVPIERKAWTQAALNPYSISVEVINSGSERVYLAPAGLAKLRQVALEVRHRTGIPVARLGALRGCVPTRSGTVDHFMGGGCAGGHHDIRRGDLSTSGGFSPVAVIRAFAGAASVLTREEAKIIRSTASPKGTGHSRRYWCGRNKTQRRAIQKVARAEHNWARRHRDVRYQKLGKSFEKRCQ